MSESPSVWRARLPSALLVLAVTGAVEWLLWRFFLGSTYYRQFFLPLALLLGIAAFAALVRVLRPRGADRRANDRRRSERRDH